MSTVKIHEQQKEWAIKAAAGVATFLFCYVAMIHPVFQNIASMRQSIAESQKRSELYREVQGLKESLDGSESVLATVTERSQLLGKISDIAGRTQIHIATLTPRTEPDGGYIRLRMEMNGQGTFFSLLKFLQAVEKIGAAIKVRDISLLWKPSSTPQEGQYPLQIQIVFETFLKQRGKKNNA
ncbi:MAG: type 4a pilus biogenesis protein PilO [Candidatus Omnitrophota bacterium]